MSMDEHLDAARPDSYYAPEFYDHWYLSDEHMINMASPSHIFGTYDDMSLLKSGLYKGEGVDSDRVYQSNAAKSVDPRLMMLLEYFKELYIRKRELLKKLFPGIQDEFAEIFRTIGAVSSHGKTQQREVKTMQRSLSLGSPRTRAISGGEPPLRLERFKIRTVVADGSGQGSGGGSGQNGQGNTKIASSK